MRLKYAGCVAAISLSLFSQGVFAGNNPIVYKNTRGSSLTLLFGSDNTVTGTFITAVASKECQEAIGTTRPVVGYTAKNAIALSVNYPECGSVVSFAGNIEKNKKTIDMTAIIARQSTEIAKEGPGARMISHEMFARV
ncbi:MAG TPA: avidin/streptavidin family protein [Gammaproteobacteria bacterium]|jgi:hypothetical protein|nr:avidin/streptavidin family protein [Gammaproteobacteria bacterium]